MGNLLWSTRYWKTSFFSLNFIDLPDLWELLLDDRIDFELFFANFILILLFSSLSLKTDLLRNDWLMLIWSISSLFPIFSYNEVILC